MVLWVLFRVPTTTTFNKVCSCMVLWVLFRVPTTTTFNKVCSCMVLWVLFRVPTTTTFNKVCSCMVLWVLFRVPTTTTFNKVCSCMVLWVLFRVPTTTTLNMKVIPGNSYTIIVDTHAHIYGCMCTVRDGCLGVDSNQRPFRHWSDALTDTGADPELWDGGGGSNSEATIKVYTCINMG